MGYYTNYNLEVENDEFNLINHEQGIINIIEFDPFDESCKWYGNECDMKKYSKKYPEFIFILHGIGENHEDQWRAYYKNGKSFTSYAKITYESYNESKLK